jgi:hypothetical protein
MKPRVLAILSCARSGSTFLDILLSNHPAVLAGGELALAHIDTGHLPNNTCSCGQLYSACPQWSPIYARWQEDHGVSLEEYAGLQQRFEYAFNASLRTAFEADALMQGPDFKRYAAMTAGLFESISTSTGVDVVTDASKDHLRALSLAKGGGVEVVMLHLVRDPRAVVWSVGKTRAQVQRRGGGGPPRIRSFGGTLLNWLTKNLQIQQTLQKHFPGKSLRIRYEDLVADPEAELGRIGVLLGLDLGDVGRRAAQGERLAVGHIVGGNKTRMDADFRLRRDVDWLERMPGRQRLVVWAAVSWLAHRYGYRRVDG